MVGAKVLAGLSAGSTSVAASVVALNVTVLDDNGNAVSNNTLEGENGEIKEVKEGKTESNVFKVVLNKKIEIKEEEEVIKEQPENNTYHYSFYLTGNDVGNHFGSGGMCKYLFIPKVELYTQRSLKKKAGIFKKAEEKAEGCFYSVGSRKEKKGKFANGVGKIEFLLKQGNEILLVNGGGIKQVEHTEYNKTEKKPDIKLNFKGKAYVINWDKKAKKGKVKGTKIRNYKDIEEEKETEFFPQEPNGGSGNKIKGNIEKEGEFCNHTAMDCRETNNSDRRLYLGTKDNTSSKKEPFKNLSKNFKSGGNNHLGQEININNAQNGEGIWNSFEMNIRGTKCTNVKDGQTSCPE